MIVGKNGPKPHRQGSQTAFVVISTTIPSLNTQGPHLNSVYRAGRRYGDEHEISQRPEREEQFKLRSVRRQKVAWKAEKLDAIRSSTTETKPRYRHREVVFGYPNKYMSKKEGREERMAVPREVTTKIETVGAKYEVRVSKAPLPTVWAKFGDGRKHPPLC